MDKHVHYFQSPRPISGLLNMIKSSIVEPRKYDQLSKPETSKIKPPKKNFQEVDKRSLNWAPPFKLRPAFPRSYLILLLQHLNRPLSLHADCLRWCCRRTMRATTRTVVGRHSSKLGGCRKINRRSRGDGEGFRGQILRDMS